ncbi:GD15384, partial [Drosophila simulans]
IEIQLDEFRLEIQRRDQEILAMAAKMKTLEEQHQDYQRHIAVLKESLCAKEEHYNMLQTDVEEMRARLEEKNRLIEKKTQGTLQTVQERNRLTSELTELKDHMDIKDRKISVLQRKIENLEDLLKEKDNQVDMARARLSAMQAHHSSSEGALTSLEEAIGDKENADGPAA